MAAAFQPSQVSAFLLPLNSDAWDKIVKELRLDETQRRHFVMPPEVPWYRVDEIKSKEISDHSLVNERRTRMTYPQQLIDESRYTELPVSARPITGPNSIPSALWTNHIILSLYNVIRLANKQKEIWPKMFGAYCWAMMYPLRHTGLHTTPSTVIWDAMADIELPSLITNLLNDDSCGAVWVPGKVDQPTQCEFFGLLHLKAPRATLIVHPGLAESKAILQRYEAAFLKWKNAARRQDVPTIRFAYYFGLQGGQVWESAHFTAWFLHALSQDRSTLEQWIRTRDWEARPDLKNGRVATMQHICANYIGLVSSSQPRLGAPPQQPGAGGGMSQLTQSMSAASLQSRRSTQGASSVSSYKSVLSTEGSQRAREERKAAEERQRATAAQDSALKQGDSEIEELPGPPASSSGASQQEYRMPIREFGPWLLQRYPRQPQEFGDMARDMAVQAFRHPFVTREDNIFTAARRLYQPQPQNFEGFPKLMEALEREKGMKVRIVP